MNCHILNIFVAYSCGYRSIDKHVKDSGIPEASLIFPHIIPNFEFFF